MQVLAIVGPTASGKTGLAIELAKKHRGEIICADSRTVYKVFGIGTAKPTALERDGIPHYGVDLAEPYDVYTAADFQTYAKQIIAEIRERGNLPIIVGGSGLYIDGVLYDYDFGDIADTELRAELEVLNTEELQEKIAETGIEMPANSSNRRHLIRAIEQGGVNRSKHELSPGTVVVGLDPRRETLELRVRQRAKLMIESGVLEEVRLLDEDYGWDIQVATGNIYRALRPIITGTSEDLDACLEDFVRLDMQLAKRQRTWFRRNKDILWFETPSGAAAYIDSLLVD